MFHILVVEDDKELCDLFSKTLIKNGYHAVSAADADTALAILEKEYIDLMITDVMMPGMNGFELVAAMRSGGIEIPVLVITAKGDISDKETGFMSGADDYMVKPINLKEMLFRVAALLRRAKSASERKLTFRISDHAAFRIGDLIMNLFMILSFLFSMGSFLGWILEAVYRRFISDSNPERKWINPGALIGPCLPLYGVSLILLYLLARQEPYLPIEAPALRKAVLFIAMAICITIVEYITGLIFIVKFKMRLWDYSQNRFNIKGIICPLYTFFWMILSAIYYFFIDPYILNALNWLAENLAFSFVIGFFYGILSIDVFTSARDWLKICNFANDNKIIVRLEELKIQIRTFKDQQKESLRFLLALRSSANIHEHLQRYKEKLSAIGISHARK